MGFITLKNEVLELWEGWSGDTQLIRLYVNGVLRSTVHNSERLITVGGLIVAPDDVLKIPCYANPPVWQADAGVMVGDMVSPTTGAGVFKATQAGFTGATEPTWPESGTVNDNSAIWERVVGLSYYVSRDKGRTWLLS